MSRPLLFLLSLSLPLSTLAQIGLECFEPGSCVNSTLVTFTKADDSNHCLFDCQANQNNTDPAHDCNWFTYYPTTGYCLQFSNCTSLQETPACPTCVSGERDCRPVYECDMEGLQCQARVLNATTTFSDRSCLQFCQENPLCEWYTFNRNDSYCVLFEDCMNRVSCPGCVSGENDCSSDIPSTEQYHKVFIAGGSDAALTAVEVIDLTGMEKNCSKPRDMLVGLSGAAGVYIGGRALLCGGESSNGSITNKCYSYNVTGNSWREEAFRMLEMRANPAAVQVDADRWWVTGGSSATSFLSSTELFNAQTNTFSVGPLLPRPLAYHCIAQVELNRFMVVGGATVGQLTTAAIYDFTTGRWETKTPLPEGRYGHFCGSVITQVGSTYVTEVVAAVGNTRNTQVYSKASNTWRIGAVYPVDTSFGSSVAYGHSFVTLGGDAGDLDLHTYNGTGSGTWVNMQLKLNVSRINSAAFIVPSSYYPCSELDF